jgi:ATP-dependent exoDNAse (exonuclease V) beta subunit
VTDGVPFETSWVQAKAELDEEIGQISAWLHQKHKSGIPWSEMAVLLRKKKNALIFQKKLIENGIPVAFEMESSRPNQQALDLANVCEAILNPSAKLAWLGALRAEGLSDDQAYRIVFGLESAGKIDPVISEFLTRLRSIDRAPQPLSKQIAQLFPPEHWRWQHPEWIQAIAYLIQWETSHIPAISIPERLRHWAHFSEEVRPQTRDSESAIRLMTIHASKGLEFTAVVIPECGVKWNRKRINQVAQTDKAEVSSEELRIFYVACTRAKSAVLCTGRVDIKPDPPEEWTCFADLIGASG